MKILITGANGFLAHYLIEQLVAKQVTVIATARDIYKGTIKNDLLHFAKMDFTNASDVEAVFQQYSPTHLIHAGAISKPDDCENNKLLADKINVEGTKTLLTAAQQYRCNFLFVSTDFVFDGKKGMYKEIDERKAVNYYGQTKIWAEDLVMQYPFDWSIIRTVLVYGKPLTGRNNIITLVKEKLLAGETYSVFSDQVRTPTYVEDLANAIVLMIERNKKGVYHISGETIVTPYQMAIATAEFLNLNTLLIKEVTAQTFIQPALRPAKTGFDIRKAKKDLGFMPVSFAEGLKKTLE
jgi:dTDP-4-dehydrorhamnose reductase